MNSKEKLILVGVITAAHGIKGDVIIKYFSSSPNSLETLPVIDDQGAPVKIKFIRHHSNGGAVCRIEGITTRNMAEEQKKKQLHCARSQMPKLDDEEFYFEDLVGLEVRDIEDNQLGKIIAVHNFGAGDIIEIQFTDKKGSEMFPFDHQHFPEISKDFVVSDL